MNGTVVFFIVVGCIFGLWQILRFFDVLTYNKSGRKLVSDISAERSRSKKRKRAIKRLGLYSALTGMFRGLAFSDILKQDYLYYIERLEIRNEPLNRNLTPDELRGKHLSYIVLGVALCFLGLLNSFILVGGCVCFFLFLMQIPVLKQKVADEDKIIEIYFIDLYLLLYSKLREGSKARLQTVVESYINTLEVASANAEMKRVMLKLGRFLLNNLMMYEDHEAVPKLREKYHSPVIVNFCNVATQSLQGINNLDSLLTLKMELTRRKALLMERNAEKLRQSGERAIMLIYVILFMFIAVGWYSKLPI